MASLTEIGSAEQIARQLSKAWQSQVVEELKGHIRDGLLSYEIIQTQHLFRSSTSDELDIGQMVKVRLFADEKISKLERENTKLRQKLMNLLECIQDENTYEKQKSEVREL